MPIARFASTALLFTIVAAGASGCVAVKSWERGRLAHPSMQMSPKLGDGFRSHMTPIREGAVGGEGQIGGGCGCN